MRSLAVRVLILSTLALALVPRDSGAQLSAEAKKAMRAAADPVVLMRTSLGDITIELFKKEAPKSTANFLSYVKMKHYDGTILHRVMPNFMIQGGNLDEKLQPKSMMGPIVNEASNGISNERGTIAMARTTDPNSATDQFFINLKNNVGLDKAKARDGAGYAVFGKVIAGMDTVDKIAAVKTARTEVSEGQPLVAVVIKSVTVVQP